MQTTLSKLPRKHRMSRDPQPGRAHAIVWPSERDAQIFELLDPATGYQYLPSNWIHAFAGGDADYLKKRLGWLQEKPNCYLYRPPQQWQSVNALYKHAVYRRDGNAEKYLQRIGRLDHIAPHSGEPYAHELLNCLVDASLNYGVSRDGSLRLIGWKELRAHGKVPLATRDAKEPFVIPLADGTLTPDGRPFILEKSTATGRRFLCVPGKEIDRHNEPLRPAQMRASWKQKIHAYKELFERKLYRHHYGFENAVIPIITTNATHMRNIMDVVGNIIGPCSYLLFRTEPDWATEPHFPKPNGDLLAAPWQRVGHPEFRLSAFTES